MSGRVHGGAAAGPAAPNDGGRPPRPLIGVRALGSSGFGGRAFFQRADQRLDPRLLGRLQGDVAEAVRIASTNDIDILTLPLAAGTPSDVAITELDLPTQLFEGERFELAFKLYASANAPATIRLLSGGEVISEETLQLHERERRENCKEYYIYYDDVLYV